MACGGTEGYCTACFDEKYPTAPPSCTAKNRFERKLSERDKGE